MTTLLVTYRRPEGGDEALATFERRYRDEHLAAIAAAPGLRSSRFWRVSGALGTETDLALVAALPFDDRPALDASRSLPAWRRSSSSRMRPTSAAPARARLAAWQTSFESSFLQPAPTA